MIIPEQIRTIRDVANLHALPVHLDGAILAGSHAYIARVRCLRKLLGGGMRQAGIIAALEKMIDRLAEDH